ncbi:MAG: hypothetical protein ABFR75_13240 [Acidobacteriota bacterium]
MEMLSGKELLSLIESVFPEKKTDKKIGILVDIPRNLENDNKDWIARRKICQNWFYELKEKISEINLEDISLIAYPDVGSNNADLPEKAYIIKGDLPDSAEFLNEYGQESDFSIIFSEFQIFLAPTEYSTTAPLKNSAKKYMFRAATMPGFSEKMIPALRIDYNEVFRRVSIIKEKLDPAIKAEISFIVDNNNKYDLDFDLRFRKSHLSSGRFPDKGTAGNLPSGETYIVPYEGEMGEKSETHGTLPVQIGDDVLLYTIIENKAVEVLGSGESFKKEENHLRREPAYGNMAELGFGVLGDFGLEPINEILLDEKLGVHIAFGRSDHFGGNVSPSDFSSPSEVIHLDRVYISKMQPRIIVSSILLYYPDKDPELIFENGNYFVF